MLSLRKKKNSHACCNLLYATLFVTDNGIVLKIKREYNA